MSEFVQKYQNEIYNKSFNFSNQAIYWIDKNGRIVFANDCALNYLGYTLEELQELFVWDVDAIVDDKEKFLEAVTNFRDNDENSFPNILETYHRRKNGEIFPVEVVSKFIEFEDAEYLISYTRDITNRLKRKEDVNFYFELIDSSSDMIFLIENGTGSIEFANETACETLGYKLVELRKMLVTDFRKPFKDFDGMDLPEIFKKLENSNSMTTFGIFLTKDGNKIPVETSLHKKNYQGKSFLVAISRNISDRLEVEKERESLNTKLKNYNHTLQREIYKAKEELIEYESIMKRQSKMAAMGEMLENIAHQWRQPLSAISVLSTGMILQNDQKQLSEEILEKGLNDINEQVQYLSKTIDEFRNYFKPTKKKTYFDLIQLINTSIKLSKARYANEDIEFITNVDNVELYTYENELLQVILNLISNAKDELIKKDYKKIIFIESYLKESNIVIHFKDNAGGIDESIINRIFEPYFTTKHKYSGTGIGLYMSQNIVKHMNGKLEVHNCEIEYEHSTYVGACFKIEIPYKG